MTHANHFLSSCSHRERIPLMNSAKQSLSWGELPSSVAYIGTGQLMGWGLRAIEIRNVDTGHLDGVFMYGKAFDRLPGAECLF